MCMFRDLKADEIECRVAQATENGVSILLYKDARCDQNILDETVGEFGWQRCHTRDNANCIVSLWDEKKQQYNPFLAMGTGEDWARWDEYLVLAMGRCTANYEKLPLVKDKALLDNILYSGDWTSFRGKGAKARDET